VAFYPDIVGILNGGSDADDMPHADEMERGWPFDMDDMQEWADSIAIAGGVLGMAFEEAGMLVQEPLRLQPEEEPAPPSFDPYECTVLREPMTLRRGRITVRVRIS
jgi:hypothetical protein